MVADELVSGKHPIKTKGEHIMNEMIRYIFGSLRCAETTMNVLSKALIKQKSFNRTIALFAVVATTHSFIQDMELKSMRDEIFNLKKEIKELKNTEGD